MPKVEGVTFDVDDTLTRGAQLLMYESMEVALASAGIHMRQTELVRRMIENWGLSHKDQVLRLLGERFFQEPDLFNRVVAEYERYLGENIVKRVVLIEGCADTLLNLNEQGKRLAINTAAPKRILEDIMIPQLGIPNVFEHVVTADTLGRAGRPKPHPYGHLQIMGVLGINPDYMVAVGDSRFDYEAGVAAGIKNSLVVLTGQLTVGLALELGVKKDHIIDDVTHVPRVIEEIESN